METLKANEIQEHPRSNAVDCSQCYLQESDPPEDHDLAKYGAVCGRCYSIAKQRLEERLVTLRSVAIDLSTDIRHWIALAERQRRELPDVDHLPCGPTTNGINGSVGLLERFQVVLREINKVL